LNEWAENVYEMSKKQYKWLIPEEIPSPLRGTIRTEYDECIDEFLKSGLESARVNLSDVKPKTLARMLVNRIKKKDLKDKVTVALRKDKVYLVKP